MGQAESTDAALKSPSYIHSKDASKDDRNNVSIVQNVLLIWLDASIDENKGDFKNTITQFRQTINTIHTFTDSQQCLQFLENVVNAKTCMIISGSLGQQVVPRVHDLSQVDSIFIFCNDKKHHERWAKDWSKIRGVFTKIEPLCKALRHAAQECEHNAASIGIMDEEAYGTVNSENRLDPSFMYTQIMKEILLTINFEQKHINEFVNHCREEFADNKKQLKIVDELAKEYRQHTPIWWYMSNFFLYSMLNRALRTMDVDLIVKMGFFISDLHRHIEQLHQKQFSGDSSKQRFIVYRVEKMDKKAFKTMVTNKGGLFSFNTFLSTVKNQSTALTFAERALADDQMVGVLFAMSIDPSRSSTPFASVADVKHLGMKDDDVLFSTHAVFRIGDITSIDGRSRLAQVQLNMASDKDNDLCDLIDHIRRETFPDKEGWVRLGAFLFKMGESTKAEQIYETLLTQETEENAKGLIYHQLGHIKQEQGEYAEAIGYYEKLIQIKEKPIHRDYFGLAMAYNNIGVMYESMRDYSKALSSHEKALAIREQTLRSNHPDLAPSYNYIGEVYCSLGDYSKALSSHEKALANKQQSLPPNHPDLASTYDNMGLLYQKLGDHSKAHSYFERAVDIGQQCLPPNHPNLEKWKKHLVDNQ